MNATGADLDQCPYTPLGATGVDEFGCAAVQRDTDSDGVNDLLDQCEGTPSGLLVNAAGCADLDGDGVFANVDLCEVYTSVLHNLLSQPSRNVKNVSTSLL